MATKIRRRLGSTLWKTVALLGWLALAAAAGVATSAGLLYWQVEEVDSLILKLAAGAIGSALLGCILVRGARLTDTVLVCSNCGQRLRADSRLCPGCQIVLE